MEHKVFETIDFFYKVCSQEYTSCLKTVNIRNYFQNHKKLPKIQTSLYFPLNPPSRLCFNNSQKFYLNYF